MNLPNVERLLLDANVAAMRAWKTKDPIDHAEWCLAANRIGLTAFCEAAKERALKRLQEQNK